jgi:hypothetical protein
VKTISPSVGKEMPAVPAGPPLPIVLHSSSEGRKFRGGLSVDVLGIVRMVMVLEPKRPR